MRVLFVYQFCGLNGVATSILNKLRALETVGIGADVLFCEYYGRGGETLLDDPRIAVVEDRRRRRDVLKRGYDAISIADHPSLIDELDEAHIRANVIFETHASHPPSLPEFYGKLNHPSVQAIVVPTQFNKECIGKLCPTSKPIHVIRCAIDTELFCQRPAAEIGPLFDSMHGGPVVIWVGRLEDEKNPTEFARIASRILKSRADAHFLVVGDGIDYDAEKERIRSAMMEGQQDRVGFIRALPYRDMPLVYSLAASSGGCLLSTSLHESYPMTFAEAMACGCPIVSTNVGGVRELIADGRTGRLYQPGEVDAGAAAALNLMDDAAARNDIVARALSVAVAEHSPGKIGRLYESLLATPAPRLTSQPLVSCIIIFLNAEAFIEEAIESVFAQSYEHWELVLVDDGSTDASTEIALSYVKRLPGKIRYVEHPGHVNRGKSASRNLGLHHAKGDYFAFLDADDVWAPHKLEQQLAILESHPEAAVVYGRTLRWFSWSLDVASNQDFLTDPGLPADRLIAPPELLRVSLTNEDAIPATCSALIRRHIVEKVGGFQENFRGLYEDAIFNSKVFLEAPVFISSGCWDKYRQHPAMSCAVAMRTRQWHHANANPERGSYLAWLGGYLAQQRVDDREICSTFRLQMRKYRHPALYRFLSKARMRLQLAWHRARVAWLTAKRHSLRQSTGSIAATPARILSVDHSRIGTTTISWSSQGTTTVEVRMDAPHGALVRRGGQAGSATVTIWAGDRTLFYLQDVTDGHPLALGHTLALVAVRADEVPRESTTASDVDSLVATGDGAGQTVILSGGKPLILDRGAMAGSIEHVLVDGSAIRVAGWAADVTENTPPCRLAVFLGGHLIHAPAMSVERPDLAAAYRCAALQTAGFDFAIPSSGAETLAPSTLRVFAISRDRAFELPRSTTHPAIRRYRLAAAANGTREALCSSGGGSIAIIPVATPGHLDVATLGDGRGVFAGWAVDQPGSEIAAEVVIFVDDEFVCARRPNAERPDVARALANEAFRWAGFNFAVRVPAAALAGKGLVRAFTISARGEACELAASNRPASRA